MWEMKKIYLENNVPPHEELSGERTWKLYKGKFHL